MLFLLWIAWVPVPQRGLRLDSQSVWSARLSSGSIISGSQLALSSCCGLQPLAESLLAGVLAPAAPGSPPPPVEFPLQRALQLSPGNALPLLVLLSSPHQLSTPSP